MEKKDLTEYKKRYLTKNGIFIRCQNCKKDLIVKKWYETNNLLFLCIDCYKKLTN